jgi:acyl-CoA-binding protein
LLDRVFVHALNTVKRIPRTGTARPPAAERLKLYGLYKQSMGRRFFDMVIRLSVWIDRLIDD